MKSKISILLFLIMAGNAQAGLIEIDFSSLSPGDAVTNQFPGVTFSLLGSPPIAGPLVEDPGSTQDAGSGGNLITPMGALTDPCCVGPFFDIQIDFDNPIDFFSILALDAEAGESFSLLAFADGVLVDPISTSSIIGSFSIPTSGGPIRENVLGMIGGSIWFDRVIIDLDNSEGPEVWDDVSYHVVSVPEPGTLSLLGAGLLAMGFRRRRRKA